MQQLNRAPRGQIQGPFAFAIQPTTPFSQIQSEDSEISYIANHLNDNLKMLLYLVDADKLKKVQNILFGKNKHSGLQQSSSAKHSAYRHQHRTKKYPHPATPPQPAAPSTMMPMPLAPFAGPFPASPTPMPVIKHHRMQPRQMKHTHTKKHKIHNQNNQNNNPEPDSESHNLAEVIPG